MTNKIQNICYTLTTRTVDCLGIDPPINVLTFTLEIQDSNNTPERF
uniref:Uncharacterized protein n=1 Tax=Triticum urartu TaxID=4572 RepID=A0A8R7UTA5_TRIUA